MPQSSGAPAGKQHPFTGGAPAPARHLKSARTTTRWARAWPQAAARAQPVSQPAASQRGRPRRRFRRAAASSPPLITPQAG